MALSIEKDSPSSISMKVTYWRVHDYTVTPGQYVNARFAGHWTEADRRAEKTPADWRTVTIPNPPTLLNVEWIYNHVKGDADFAGAIDV